MGDIFELDINPSKVCRFCLSENLQLQNLFANTIVDGYMIALPNIIMKSIDIEVKITETEMPSKMCEQCKQQIVTFYTFKEKCKRTDVILRKTFLKPEESWSDSTEMVTKKRKLDDRSISMIECSTQTDVAELLVPDPVITEVELLDILEDSNPSTSVSLHSDAEDKDDKLMNCSICELQFDKFNDYHDHLYEHVDTKNMACELCFENFPDMGSLRHHFQFHHEISINKLNDFLTLNEDLSTPTENPTEEPISDIKLELTIEGYDNSNEEVAAVAIEIDHDSDQEYHNKDVDDVDNQLHDDDSVNLFECNLCSNMYVDQTLLYNHLQQHRFYCINCCLAYENRSQLERHNKLHHSPDSTDTDDIELPCTMCKSTFYDGDEYDSHIRMHATNIIIDSYIQFYSCSKCRIIFLSDEELSAHNEKHDEMFEKAAVDVDLRGNDFRCGVCMGKYHTEELAKHHVVSHGHKILCPVEKCGLQHNTFSRFRLHVLRKHILAKTAVCLYCGDVNFENFEAVQLHMKTDCPRREINCDHCDRKFFNKKGLWNHKRKVSSKIMYSCEICDKTFPLNAQLTLHTRTHTGERPYECTVCGKAYKTSSMRASHMDSHIKGKTFECSVCGMLLQTRSCHRNHMKRHTAGKQHECDICLNRFHTKWHLKMHRQRIHEKDILKLNNEEFSWSSSIISE